MKQRKEVSELRRRLEASPGYLESLQQDAEIILEGEKAGRWKTLEEIEKERQERQKPQKRKKAV